MKKEKLKINGTPIRTDGWPKWPPHSEGALQQLNEVLKSQRWAITGLYACNSTFERRFANKFADYCGVDYCVLTDHCSSALLTIFESLDIGFGDEVIIPALTWVATATSVVNVNAIPVLVDVDPTTLCIDPEKVEQSITADTKAIVPVHLYSGMANMRKLLKISDKYQIPIIEDCAHVHGAKWQDKRAGSIGIAGAFSMQQGKALTAGEGGAVTTNDENIARRVELLRTDARVYLDETSLNLFDVPLVTLPEIQGTNFCLSEFQAAILLEQLTELEERNLTKQRNAEYLDSLLLAIDGLCPLPTYKEVTQRTYYCYVVKVEREKFGDLAVKDLCMILKAELNIPFFPIYEPLNTVASYNPMSKKRNKISDDHLKRLDFRKYDCPEAATAYNNYISFPHWVLLGTQNDMEDIAKAFLKVQNV